MIELIAYCVMTNHFHLLIRSTTGDMSSALQWLESVYVKKFNRSYDRDGPLLKGRFFSKEVKSEAYLENVMAYIDSNPVEARIVTAAPEYPFSSTHDYLRADGPPWLARSLIESFVCRRTGTSVYDPAAYATVFGRKWTLAALRWFQRFSEGTGQDDPDLDGVFTGRPEHVQQWLDRCAREGDGSATRSPIVDVVSVLEVVAACASAQPDWQVQQSRKHRPGWDVLLVGLARDLSSESFAEMGRRIGRPSRSLYGMYPTHRALMASDAEYRAIAQSTALAIIDSCHRGQRRVG